jgi:hypothetical protein
LQNKELIRCAKDARELPFATTLVEASPHDRVWGIGLAADDPRVEYGGQILPTLSAKLVPEYAQGYSDRNLARMIRFAEVFPTTRLLGRCPDNWAGR